MHLGESLYSGLSSLLAKCEIKPNASDAKGSWGDTQGRLG